MRRLPAPAKVAKVPEGCQIGLNGLAKSQAIRHNGADDSLYSLNNV